MSNQPPAPTALKPEEYNKVARVETDFRIIKKLEDPRFGQVAIIEAGDSNRKLMVKEKVFNSKVEVTNEIKAIKSRLELQTSKDGKQGTSASPYLLNLVDYSTGERGDFCSTFYWIKIYFEYPDHDLEQELRRRARFNLSGLNFEELCYLLFQVARGAAFLYENGQGHGDICPETIEMDSPTRYRLVEKFGDLSSPHATQELKIHSNQDLHLAPEVFARHLSKVKNAKAPVAPLSQDKADVFSFGLTLIQAGVDQTVQSVYRPEIQEGKKPITDNRATGGQINQAALERLYSQFRARFNLKEHEILTNTVKQMIELDPNNRPDFKTLLSRLPTLEQFDAMMRDQKARNPNFNQIINSSNRDYSGFYGSQAPVSNPNQAYSQYIQQSEWETDWGNARVAGQQPKGPNLQGGRIRHNLNAPVDPNVSNLIGGLVNDPQAMQNLQNRPQPGQKPANQGPNQPQPNQGQPIQNPNQGQQRPANQGPGPVNPGPNQVPNQGPNQGQQRPANQGPVNPGPVNPVPNQGQQRPANLGPVNPGPAQVTPTTFVPANPAGNRQTTPTQQVTPNPYTVQPTNPQTGRVATINNTQYDIEYFYLGSDSRYYPGDANGNFQDGTGRWGHSTEAYYLASDGKYYPHNAWAGQGASGFGAQGNLSTSAQSYPNANGYRGY